MPRSRGLKITFIGGGSYNWGPSLINDLVLSDGLDGSEVWLLDLRIAPAEEIAAAARAMNDRFGKRFRFRPTTSAPKALSGADFVVITITAGGLGAMKHDLKIPERYGIFQTVGDTVGPGGWARALRSIPVFVRLGGQIRRHAPNAVVLNYTNPMGILTRVLCEVSDLRVVGLCHGLFENYAALQSIFGVQEKDISLRFAGLNHFFWILDFAIKGRPGYPLLRRKLRGRRLPDLLREAYEDPHGHRSDRYVADELLETYGYLPYLGDRHTSEFFPHYLTPKRSALRKYALRQTTIEDRLRGARAARRRALDIARGRGPVRERPTREAMVNMIQAVAMGREMVDVVNLPNTGQIANLPFGTVVETLGVVNGLGFTPMVAGGLPTQIQQAVLPHAINQGLVTQAGLSGDYDKAMQALQCDPLCAHLSPDVVRAMGDELLSAHRGLLPQFRRRRRT